MPLINFTKEELYKIMECINGDADSYGDTVCESILDKIANLDDLCECGGKSNWYIIQHNEVVSMSDEEIKTFITTFKSFMQHADVEEMNYLRRESTRKYKQLYYQSQAKKHNVSYDYYLHEFT